MVLFQQAYRTHVFLENTSKYPFNEECNKKSKACFVEILNASLIKWNPYSLASIDIMKYNLHVFLFAFPFV